MICMDVTYCKNLKCCNDTSTAYNQAYNVLSGITVKPPQPIVSYPQK